MHACTAWQISGEAALRDATQLLEWAHGVDDPLRMLHADTVDTPAIDEIARTLRQEIDHGSGVAWVRDLGVLDEPTLRLVYLKIGLAIGDPIDTYGRLYDVKDTGASYRDNAIPVSQTRESTGMHTDSSGKDVLPCIVGLACVRQAREGGRSRVVSAAQAHETLRAEEPRLLARLYEDFVRDVITPGSDRDPKHVAKNRFPVFSYDHRLVLRYMRYWIERGHARIGLPIDPEAVRAFDALDAALGAPEHVLEFRMAPGDLLFIDNTRVAHDRDAYREDPRASRLMLRLWLADHQRANAYT
jgi:hypothetical protein